LSFKFYTKLLAEIIIRQTLSPIRFLIFSLLLPFVHREGDLGQQARDALLLCMALSNTNPKVGQYIADTSNFCPVSSYLIILSKLLTRTRLGIRTAL